MAEDNNKCIGIAIPQNAVEIKVTSFINPYHIRMSKLPIDRNKRNAIYRLLQKIVNSERKKGSKKQYTPAVGDDIIVVTDHEKNINVDLPDWLCRGVVIDTEIVTSEVFLLDYGIAINVSTDSLIKYQRSSVPIETLTESIGLYNLLPLSEKFHIIKQWPKPIVDFVKYLIETSKKVYFHPLIYHNKTRKHFGEIFLVIKDKNINLNKILINSLLAIPLDSELLETIKSSNNVHDISIPYHLQTEIDATDTRHSEKNSTSKEKNISYNAKLYCKRNKHANEQLLIRSKFECRPIEDIADSGFTTLVHKALKNQGVRSLKTIQSYMWPAIKQGFNVVTIHSKASGKTLGYTVPIVSCIANNEGIILDKQKGSTATAPTALILCATVYECVNVAAKCKEILYYHKDIKTFAAFSGLSDKNITTSIYNKFNILVSTPSFLLRLLKNHSKKLILSELSYLVLDHADDILAKYFEEIMALIRDYKIINKEPVNLIQGSSTQIIAVANTWTDKIDSFSNMFMKDPYICIGSFIEAAAFCKVQGRMLIRHSDKKNQEILGILGDYLKVKTMIFCVDAEEANNLNDFLNSNSIKTLMIHENVFVTKLQELEEEWFQYLPGMYPVFICTDQVLSQLKISNIEYLIHYSITSTSKTQFNRRFSVLMDNWLMEVKTKCKVLILFDETKENAHFKGVVNILKRLNVEMPEDWNLIADGLDLANNLKKKNYPLCYSIKIFGVCETYSCPYRHRIIAEVDKPTTNISVGDELKLNVTYVHDASHFSARLIECKKSGIKEPIKYQFNILKLNMEMQKYYADHKNRTMEKDICVGKVCTMRNSENIFSRVSILNIVETDFRTGKARTVRARCIDNGQLLDRVHVHELFELPDEFLQYELVILDIFLSNIAPFDEEYKWSEIATEDVFKWFKDNCHTSSHVSVKVSLHVGHSIWTDKLTIRSKLIGYPDLVSESLNEFIKKRGHGTDNDKHMANLLKLCYNGNLREINGYSIDLPLDKKNGTMNDCD